MRKLIIIGLIVSAVAFIACNKGGYGPADDNGPHVVNPADTTDPVIEIYTPTESQVFASGNPMSITGKVVDSGGLYRGSIRVIDDANGNVVKEQAYEIHSVISYNYTVSYTPSVSTISNYTVKVSFEDHGLNIATRSVKVKINP